MFYNKNVTYAYFSYKNTQNISIRSQSLTRWTTFLGHLPKRLYFDAEIITDDIQNWSIMKIMMHYCMLTWKVGILTFTDPMIDQFVTGYHLTPFAAAVNLYYDKSICNNSMTLQHDFTETWDEKLALNLYKHNSYNYYHYYC